MSGGGDGAFNCPSNRLAGACTHPWKTLVCESAHRGRDSSSVLSQQLYVEYWFQKSGDKLLNKWHSFCLEDAMSACSVAPVVTDSLQCCGLYLARLLYPWDSPGKNIGEGCHALLPGIFLTQGWNPHLLHWEAWVLYH